MESLTASLVHHGDGKWEVCCLRLSRIHGWSGDGLVGRPDLSPPPVLPLTAACVTPGHEAPAATLLHRAGQAEQGTARARSLLASRSRGDALC